MGRIIKIARDFSLTPGSRYKDEGNFSAEEFREDILTPEYCEAVKNGYKLTIDFDGALGYGTSWLEASFGGLARKYGVQDVLNVLIFVSTEEPYLIEDVINYIKNAKG